MSPNSPLHGLAQVTFLVRDYDEAIAFFTVNLGFDLIEDTELDASGKRWVVVAPHRDLGARLLLARADGPEQIRQVGKQGGGRVAFFLYTDYFRRDHERMTSNGVRFVRGGPRDEPYGTVAVFEDLYGNLWDLIEPNAP